MFFAYILTSLVIGLFMSYVWSSNGFVNTMIKVGFTLYTLWTAAIAIGYLAPKIAESGMRLF
jgi:hypothetical protein